MTNDMIQALLGWCFILNYGILLWWAIVFIFAHDWMYRLHKKWFNLSEENFDALHYLLMGMYKVGVILFNLIPYIALRLIA